jgi:hypothetical protein
MIILKKIAETKCTTCASIQTISTRFEASKLSCGKFTTFMILVSEKKLGERILASLHPQFPVHFVAKSN